jgi:7-carboxy-7-deazaguanine synthase
MTEKKYRINEIFLSPQGEGGRAGEMSVFVRFTGCNLRCSMKRGERSPGGFDCDTEFESGEFYDLNELLRAIYHRSVGTPARLNKDGTPTRRNLNKKTWASHAYLYARWVVLTGGEPALQVDAALIAGIHRSGFKIAIETNGSRELPPGIDWITVSPKMAEHTLRQLTANEIKYVRHEGQGIPRPRIQADLKWLSPAYMPNGRVHPGALQTCLGLIRNYPEWRISEQQHKRWGVR